MKQTTPLSRGLAWIGAVLVWTPIVFPVLLSLSFWIQHRIFRFDFLMPAELLILFFPGSLMLYAAARQIGHLASAIGRTALFALLALAASQGTAVLTGLASGAREATGWPLILTVTFLVIYTVFVVHQGALALTMLRWMKTNSR